MAKKLKVTKKVTPKSKPPIPVPKSKFMKAATTKKKFDSGVNPGIPKFPKKPPERNINGTLRPQDPFSKRVYEKEQKDAQIMFKDHLDWRKTKNGRVRTGGGF